MNAPTAAAAAPPAQGGAAVVIPDDDATKLSGRRAALLISTLLLGVLSFQLNASMVTPALPQIAASFGESADSAAPVQSMFFLAGAIAGPVIGRWSDFIGRRAALLLVLGIMGAGTILCIAAPTLPLLVTGRFLQGVSSVVFALAYIVLSENLQAKVFGISVGINGGIGGVDGYVGGLMAETLGFRSIFVVVLVLTTIAALCILRLVPAGRPAGVRGAMDWWGFTSSVWRAPVRSLSKGRMRWMPMRGSVSEMKRPTPRCAPLRPSSSRSMRAPRGPWC